MRYEQELLSNMSFVPFGDLLLEPLRNGLTKPKAVRGDGVKMIGMGEIFANSRIGAISMSRVPVTEKELSNNCIKNGDILFARQSLALEGAGKCSIVIDVTEETVFESHLIRARIDSSKANPYFVYYYFNSYVGKEHIKTIVEQVAAAGIRGSDLVRLKVPCPDLETQDRIAAILSALDEKIAINRAINDNLEQQAKALYQQMFIDNPVPGGCIGTLSDIADITMGQSPNGSSYNEDGNGTVFFQGRAEFGFRFPSVRLYTTEPKRMACTNDTLMSVRAPVGDLNVAYTDCCIGRGLAAIHSKSNQQSFILYTMFSLRKQLDVFNGEGTVFGSINRTSLNELPIFIPSDREIVKFEAIVAPIDAAIRNNYEEICRLEKIRDTLLPKLMSGELDVSAVEL